MYESIYIKVFHAAKEIKRHYFSWTLDKFNKDLLKKLDDGSWAKEDREKEYIDLVIPYWKKYDRRPGKFWFELNCSREQHMDPRFIPSDLYYNELLPYINNIPFRYALQDKCSLDLRFPDVKQAGTICRRMAGVFYDPEMNVISSDEAVRLCMEQKDKLFIKPSLYTAAGRGIETFDTSVCTEDHVRELFAETGKNFIVQETIKQNSEIAKLNPDSVSTIRVTSMFIDNEVYIANVMMRIGAPGMPHVATDGGYSVEILPDGHLYPRAYRDKGIWVTGSEQGLYDDDLMIPGMDKVREAVMKLHPRIPYFKWIGWDFSVDEEGDPVMIEFNTSPGDDIQRVCGKPLFGDKTERVLDDYFITRSMEQDQLPDLWMGSDVIRRY